MREVRGERGEIKKEEKGIIKNIITITHDVIVLALKWKWDPGSTLVLKICVKLRYKTGSRM